MIMIMPFDLFGEGKYRYTFRHRCDEAENVYLKDGAVKIFLNTKGKNLEEVSAELVDFLKYVEASSKLPESGTQNERLIKIHNKVQQIKSSEEMGVRYMQEWEEKVLIKQEGMEQGTLLGKAESVSSIVKGLKISLEKACEIIGISPEEYKAVTKQKQR